MQTSFATLYISYGYPAENLKYMQTQIHYGYSKNEKIIQYPFDLQDFDNLGLENEEEDHELCEALEKSLQEIDASKVSVAKKCYSK